LHTAHAVLHRPHAAYPGVDAVHHATSARLHAPFADLSASMLPTWRQKNVASMPCRLASRRCRLEKLACWIAWEPMRVAKHAVMRPWQAVKAHNGRSKRRLNRSIGSGNRVCLTDVSQRERDREKGLTAKGQVHWQRLHLSPAT
jgi:hypothetical protein